jgi:hypothetical protein
LQGNKIGISDEKVNFVGKLGRGRIEEINIKRN